MALPPATWEVARQSFAQAERLLDQLTALEALVNDRAVRLVGHWNDRILFRRVRRVALLRNIPIDPRVLKVRLRM